MFTSVSPTCWQLVSAARREQLELLEQRVAGVSQDRMGLLQSPNLVQMRKVSQSCACNFTAHFDTLHSVRVFHCG